MLHRKQSTIPGRRQVLQAEGVPDGNTVGDVKAVGSAVGNLLLDIKHPNGAKVDS